MKQQKMICKGITVLLTLVLLAGTFCGCGKTKLAYVYDSIQIDGETYNYWLSYYKSYYITKLGGTDSPDFLEKELQDGLTYASFLTEQAQANMKTNLLCLSLFNRYGLELTADETNAVEQSLSSRVSDFGSKETLDSYLGKMGMDYDKLREVLLMEAKVSKLTTYLYGDSAIGTTGAVTISDDEVSQFYQKHYTAFKLILIRTDGKNVLNETGEATKNEDGTLITEPFTEAELAEKEQTVKEIEARLDAGDSFDELQSLFNQDADGKSYPEGYLVSDFYSVFSDSIAKAVEGLQVGEHTTVKDDTGYEILTRVGLPAAPYNDENYTNMMNGFTDYLHSANFAAKTADAMKEVRENEDVISTYDIAAVDTSFFTYSKDTAN